MDFEKIILTRFETKILRLILKHDYLNAHQLHGYFKFPDFDVVLVALSALESSQLIKKRDLRMHNEFAITPAGERYLMYLRKKRKTNIYLLLGAIAAVATIAGVIADLILR